MYSLLKRNVTPDCRRDSNLSMTKELSLSRDGARESAVPSLSPWITCSQHRWSKGNAGQFFRGVLGCVPTATQISERKLPISWVSWGVGQSLRARNFPHRSGDVARHPGLPLRGKWTTRCDNHVERLHTGETLSLCLLSIWPQVHRL